MKNTIKILFIATLITIFMFSFIACSSTDSTVLDDTKASQEEEVNSSDNVKEEESKADNNDTANAGKEITVTTDSFEADVLSSKGVLLVDFWAEWCGPCVALAPILEEVSAETGVTIAKVNVDENPELASTFEIQGIPAVFIVVDGQPEGKIVGLNPKESYIKAIDSFR